MRELKNRLIECLKMQGADLVGCADAAALREEKVFELMPECKTVVVAGFRVLRGAHRGVEDGTTYYQYTTMGVETVEENVMPIAMLRACALLDDEGYAALPQRKHQTVRADVGGTNPEINYEEILHGRFTEIELDYDKLAVAAGLGELGLHGGLLTDKFGPLVRLCAILTDAPLPADAVQTPHLCDNCGKCRAACPGKAIGEKGRNDWQCATYYMGASMKKNPFLPPDAFAGDPERLAILTGEAQLSPERAREVIDRILYYPSVKHGYASSICGRACHRACYAHLEEQGKLTKGFKNRLRDGEEWQLPLL